jgi:hypothetical protein
MGDGINIKIGVKGLGCGLNSCSLGQGVSEHGNNPSCSIESGEFLDQLNYYSDHEEVLSSMK